MRSYRQFDPPGGGNKLCRAGNGSPSAQQLRLRLVELDRRQDTGMVAGRPFDRYSESNKSAPRVTDGWYCSGAKYGSTLSCNRNSSVGLGWLRRSASGGSAMRAC